MLVATVDRVTTRLVVSRCPKVGARCGKSARRVLSGGRPERAVPTGMQAPVKTGMRKQVSETSRHRRVEQVLSWEVSNPGKPNPCARWGDPRSEA